MITSKITHEVKDYWFDKTIERYIPNSRQRFEIESSLSIGKPKYSFLSDMVVLFYGSWGQNNNCVFCKIQIKSVFDFTTDKIGELMVTESLWLFLKQQYQLAINIFRQQHFGTLILPCSIDLNAINEEVYEGLKEKYKDLLLFQDLKKIDRYFNPYWSSLFL